MNRIEDETGISGTGIISEGVEFGDGSVALRWTTAHRSWCMYTSMTEVIAIHGHRGRTALEWIDPDPETPKIFIEADMLSEATLAERDRCAKIARRYWNWTGHWIAEKIEQIEMDDEDYAISAQERATTPLPPEPTDDKTWPPTGATKEPESTDEIEAEMRRLEHDPKVSKRQLRLFLQHPMSCGHAVENLLTCDTPPNGCAVCLNMPTGRPPQERETRHGFLNELRKL